MDGGQNKRARYTRCFEHLVAEAGMSCLDSCHQWQKMDGGQNVSERLGFANMMNKRVVPCNTLQDVKVEQVIRFFPRN